MLKVANRSFSVAEGSPARCVSERSKGGDYAPGDSKGRSPWRFFGYFLIGEKVTRVQGGAPAGGRRGYQPRKSPGGLQTALFALAALRSGSRRAAFCHRKRPICHFEVVGESVLFFSLVLRRKDFVLLIRGAGGWVARLGATLGLNGV